MKLINLGMVKERSLSYFKQGIGTLLKITILLLTFTSVNSLIDDPVSQRTNLK
jgi:hypothetical protein